MTFLIAARSNDNDIRCVNYETYYSGHGILANIFLTFLKKNDVNQSLASLINDNY
jgi:hypothetical protein